MKQVGQFNLQFVANIFVLLLMPLVAFADEGSGLIPCTNECGFNDLLQLINNLIQFSIEFLVLPIFIIILIYAGWLYLTANGKPGVHAKVKNMLWHALIGLLIVLCSWLIVKVLLSAIGYEPGLRFLE